MSFEDALVSLAEKAKSGRLALFVGADFSEKATGLPPTRELARGLAQASNRPTNHSLAEVANQLARFRYASGFLPGALPAGEPGQIHRAIAALPVPYLLTAAYDGRLDQALRNAERGHNTLVVDGNLNNRKFNRTDLIYLRGRVNDPATLVVSSDEHADLVTKADRKRLFDDWVIPWLREKTVLVLGCDPSGDADFFNHVYWEVLRHLGAFKKEDGTGDFLIWPELEGLAVAGQFENNPVLTLVDAEPLTFLDALADRLAGEEISVPPDPEMEALKGIMGLFARKAPAPDLAEAQFIHNVAAARQAGHQLRSIQVNFNLKLDDSGQGLDVGLDVRFEPDTREWDYDPEPAGVDLARLTAWSKSVEAARENKETPPHEEGQALIEAILAGAADKRRGYEQALFLGSDFSDRFRIVFNLYDRRLSPFPWELLHDGLIGAGGEFGRGLGFLGLKYPVYRRLNDGVAAKSLRIEARIRRALIVGADPTNRLKEMPDEVAWLASALKEHLGEDGVEAIRPGDEIVNHPEQIKDLIRDGGYQLVHFAGHAQFNPGEPKESKLQLGQPKRKPQRLTAEELAEVARESALTFVYVSACEGGEEAGEAVAPWQEAGIVDALVRSGVPAALGMRWKVADPQAHKLTEVFYSGLLKGMPSEVALMRARQAVRPNPDWANPILTKRNNML